MRIECGTRERTSRTSRAISEWKHAQTCAQSTSSNVNSRNPHETRVLATSMDAARLSKQFNADCKPASSLAAIASTRSGNGRQNFFSHKLEKSLLTGRSRTKIGRISAKRIGLTPRETRSQDANCDAMRPKFGRAWMVDRG
jgi:hypothetical protein